MLETFVTETSSKFRKISRYSAVPFLLYSLMFHLFLTAVYSLNTSVVARLRSLRTDDPLSKGHPRSINQELEL